MKNKKSMLFLLVISVQSKFKLPSHIDGLQTFSYKSHVSVADCETCCLSDSRRNNRGERIIYLSHRYPFEILHVLYPVPKEHVRKLRIGMNSYMMGDPTPTNKLISFLIQIQTMSQRTLLRQFMRYS